MATAMGTTLPPVSKEQAFLETYFQCLSKFAYDKAKDMSEKEKDLSRTSHSGAWLSLITGLVNMSVAEKEYGGLLFLAQNLGLKFFGRKDTLRNSYTYLLGEFRKLEESISQQVLLDPTQGNTEQLLGHLCGQLGQFVTARLKLMDFYEQVHAMSHSRIMNYEDLLIVISDIISAHSKTFHHPILSPIKSCFSLECEVINHLLQAQLQMQTWQLLSSLLHLHQAHSKLASWAPAATSKEGKKISFVSPSKQAPVPVSWQWLAKYKGLLAAKFSLYFYDVLSKQAPAAEVKALLAKASVDFYGKIATFHRKSDAMSVCLVLDVNGIEDTYKGPGYHHPMKVMEPPRGLDSYPAIFTCPGERPERHWPSVVSIMNDRAMSHNAADKIVHFYDDKLQSTYFLSRVEPRITFVVIFETKKSERDSYVNNFVSDICSQLRCTKLFAGLKPGLK